MSSYEEAFTYFHLALAILSFASICVMIGQLNVQDSTPEYVVPNRVLHLVEETHRYKIDTVYQDMCLSTEELYYQGHEYKEHAKEHLKMVLLDSIKDQVTVEELYEVPYAQIVLRAKMLIPRRIN